MPLRIEDYALIGDTQTAALVGIDGSIDWLCAPRFDSSACFAALLGDDSNGRWRVAAKGMPRATRRRYLPGALVLETEWVTETGVVRVTDFMPVRTTHPDVIRLVHGISGTVEMEMELVVRFDYGRLVPWARRVGGDLVFVSGPDSLLLRTGSAHAWRRRAHVRRIHHARGRIRIVRAVVEPIVRRAHASHRTRVVHSTRR